MAGPRDASGAITQLTQEVFTENIGSRWKTIKHRHLTFSNQAFNLESLDGPSLAESRERKTKGEKARGGILDLDVTRLETLDVCDNSLADIDCIQADTGFEVIRILKARRNQIT